MIDTISRLQISLCDIGKAQGDDHIEAILNDRVVPRWAGGLPGDVTLILLVDVVSLVNLDFGLPNWNLRLSVRIDIYGSKV